MCTFGIFSISLLDKKRRGLSSFQVRHTHTYIYIDTKEQFSSKKNSLVNRSKNPFDSSNVSAQKTPCWKSEGLRDKEEGGEERRKFFFLEGGEKDGREVALEETRGTIESEREEVEKRKGRGERWWKREGHA